MFSFTSILELLNGVRAAAVAVVKPDGTQLSGFDPSVPATGTFTDVPSAASNTPLLPANANRRQAYVYNASIKTLRVALGFTATATDYSFPIAGNTGTWIEFAGAINGKWDAVNGSAKITEITT